MTTETPVANRRRWQLFRRDTEGVAIIEFAMVVPVLLLLYLGSVDLCLGVTIYRKVLHADSMMNDLVTRVNSVTKSDLDGIMDMGNAAVAPRAAKLGSVKISSISIDATGKATVGWSRARDTTPDPAGSAITLPGTLAGLKNTNLVRTSVSYNFTPLGGGFGITGPILMQKEVYAPPRTGTGVTCSDC